MTPTTPSGGGFRPPHQSSSSSCPRILACLALSASASPPARLVLPVDVLSGVSLPLLSPPLMLVLMLTALSLAVGGGGGFLTAGRLVGGAGGFGLAFPPAGRVAVPLGTTATATGGGGGGGGRTAAGGGCGSSFK
jgi:hypothetical protein